MIYRWNDQCLASIASITELENDLSRFTIIPSQRNSVNKDVHLCLWEIEVWSRSKSNRMPCMYVRTFAKKRGGEETLHCEIFRGFQRAQLCARTEYSTKFSSDNSSYQGIRRPIVEVIGQEIRTSPHLPPPRESARERGPSRCTLTIRPPHRLRLPCKRHEKLFCWSNGARVHRASILSVPDYRVHPPTNWLSPSSISHSPKSSAAICSGLSIEHQSGDQTFLFPRCFSHPWCSFTDAAARSVFTVHNFSSAALLRFAFDYAASVKSGNERGRKCRLT